MASVSISYNDRVITLSVTQTSIDAANNRSTVTWTLTSTGTTNYPTLDFSVYIDGTYVAGYPARIPSNPGFPMTSGSASGTRTVAHGSDGKKTLTIKLVGGISAETPTTQQTSFALTPTSPVLTNASNFNETQNPTINYSNPGGSGVPYLIARISDGAGTTFAAWRDVPKTGSSYTFTLTEAEKNALLDATPGPSISVQFALEAKSGWRSTLYRTFTVSDTSATRPTATLGTVTPDNSAIPSDVRSDFSGLYVQGFSKVTASVTASAKRGTTISSRGVTVGGKDYAGASVTSDILAVSGSIQVKAYATDARNHTGTSSAQTITVQAYEAPKFAPATGKTNVLCYRSTNAGVEDHSSIKVWLAVKGSISSVNGANGITAFRYRYKLTSSSTYGSWTNLTPVNGEYDGLLPADFTASNEYNIQVQVTDKLGGSVTRTFTIGTEDVTLSLGAGGKSVGIGRFADTSDDYTVKVGWEAHFDDEVFAKYDGVERSVTEVVGNVWFNFIQDVTANSTATIKTLGIIPATAGYYLITLMSSSNNDDEGSIYIVRYLSSTDTYRLTVIHEGTATQAPRITSTGVLKLNSSTSEYNIRALVFRFYKGA